MIKLGVNTVLFARLDLRAALQHIAWAGYDGAELSAIKGMCDHLDLDRWEEQVTEIKSMAEEFGLDLLAMEEAALDEDRLTRAFEAA